MRSILTVSGRGLAAIAIVAVVVAIVVARRGRRLLFATFDPDGAHTAGINVTRPLIVHHVRLALTVIASISVVGIVLVNALLVIPVATAKLLARSLGQMFVLTPVLGIGRVVAGLMVPSGVDAPCDLPPHGPTLGNEGRRPGPWALARRPQQPAPSPRP